MQKIQHKLSLTIKTPKTAKEGEDFDFILRVKNIGDTQFSGTIIIQLLWQSLPEKVYKEINIENPLAPNEETPPMKSSQEPLSTGFTWFYVVNAVSSDGNPVQVFKDGTVLMFPYPITAIAGRKVVSKPTLHAIRTRTIDQINQQNALIATSISLIAVVVLQTADWILRYYSLI